VTKPKLGGSVPVRMDETYTQDFSRADIPPELVPSGAIPFRDEITCSATYSITAASKPRPGCFPVDSSTPSCPSCPV
jgi:hypothetical protein